MFVSELASHLHLITSVKSIIRHHTSCNLLVTQAKIKKKKRKYDYLRKDEIFCNQSYETHFQIKPQTVMSSCLNKLSYFWIKYCRQYIKLNIYQNIHTNSLFTTFLASHCTLMRWTRQALCFSHKQINVKSFNMSM